MQGSGTKGQRGQGQQARGVGSFQSSLSQRQTGSISGCLQACTPARGRRGRPRGEWKEGVQQSEGRQKRQTRVE